jgi:hypothetical protein
LRANVKALQAEQLSRSPGFELDLASNKFSEGKHRMTESREKLERAFSKYVN